MGYQVSKITNFQSITEYDKVSSIEKSIQLTIAPGPARDKKTGRNRRPLNVPIHINARRRLKKYLKDKLVTNVIMYMKKIG